MVSTVDMAVSGPDQGTTARRVETAPVFGSARVSR
jgi:hypothetical protein